MIKTHRAQRSFGDGLIAEEVKDLHEAWMRHADQLLGDPQIVAAVYEALAQRHPQSRKRGRPGGKPAQRRWVIFFTALANDPVLRPQEGSPQVNGTISKSRSLARPMRA